MRLLNYIIVFLLLVSCAATGGSKITTSPKSYKTSKKKPWVSKRPINHLYYIGIGIAEKGSNENYRDIAQQNGLKDLASQIKISIASEEIHQIVEKSSGISDSYESFMKAAVQDDLEGYELMDTYENDSQYWVYFRLSKEKYAEIRAQKISQAIKLAVDYILKAKDEEKVNNVPEASKLYFQAVKAVEKYANESLETTIGGKKVFLMNELVSSLQKVISKIILEPVQNVLQVSQGTSSYPNIGVKAIAKSTNGAKNNASYLPVLLTSSSGSEFLNDKIATDASGLAKGSFKSINSSAKEQIVFVQINYLKLSNSENATPIISGIISNLPDKKIQINVLLKGLTAFIKGEEFNLGRKETVAHIMPAVKNSLTDKGFTFTNTPAEADWVIEIKASTTQGAKMYGMFSSFADVDISVKLSKTGEEIFRKAIHHKKGLQLNYRQAGLKALENSAKKAVEEIVPEIIDLIENKK